MVETVQPLILQPTYMAYIYVVVEYLLLWWMNIGCTLTLCYHHNHQFRFGRLG
jgi:hypothetical protein